MRGNWGKFINLRLLTVFATCAVALAYQNCSKSFINGEPYEGVVANPGNAIISPVDGIGADPRGLENPVELLCLPANSQSSFGELAFGKRKGTNEDTIALKDSSGSLFLYKWPVGQDPMIINKAFTQGIMIDSIEYIDQFHVAVNYSQNTEAQRQNFNCQRPQ